MQEILYRQLVPEDYGEYKRTRLDCLRQYPGNFGGTYKEELNAGSLKLHNAIKAADDHNFAYGAFTGKRLIGICGFISESRLKTRHRGEIVQMFVDAAYNGYGIGKELLQQVINKAFSNDKTEQIILSVVSSNEKAIALYKKMGFIEYGKLENYFKSGAVYTSQSFLFLPKPSSNIT